MLVLLVLGRQDLESPLLLTIRLLSGSDTLALEAIITVIELVEVWEI
jgi:hypothetical protein